MSKKYSLMAKYTIQKQRSEYGTDAQCLDKIFKARYGRMEICPCCRKQADFKRITTRRSYQCRYCYHQIYPTAGTVFEKTRVPLSTWFYVMYLFCATRNGVSAKEVERQTGVTYKTAWRMCRQIRILMSMGKDRGMFSGFVEVDETHVGGKISNKASKRKLSRAKYGPNDNKTIVAGVVERRGNASSYVVKGATKEELLPIIESKVEKGTNISTDENVAYKDLKNHNYNHGTVRHMMKEYVKGWVSTNTIEGHWSGLKRMIIGTHLGVSEKYLQLYANENDFRFNHRKIPHRMFLALILRIGRY